MKRIVISAGIIALLVCSAIGCGGSRDKENLQKFNQAQALFENVKRCVAEGKLDEAHADYDKARDILTEIRRRSGPLRMGDADLPVGPKLMGVTAAQWQERWAVEMEMAFERNYDALVAKATDGTLDWSRGRSYINTYAPKLDSRWVETAAAIDASRLKREGDIYLFECQSEEMGNCDAIRKLIASKTAKPLSTRNFVTGKGRGGAFGLIQVKVELGDWKSYNQPDSKNPSQSTAGYTIPSRAYATFNVSTRKASSNWDGETRFMAEVDLPETLSSSALLDTKKQAIYTMQQNIEHQFAVLDQQTLQVPEKSAGSPEAGAQPARQDQEQPAQ
jgi:hypothetical protein